MGDRFVSTWATSEQPVEPMPAVPAGVAFQTLRQKFRISLGGEQARLRIANTFGDEPLQLRNVELATQSQVVPLTFQGLRPLSIPPRERVTSDPFALCLSPLATITVTLEFGAVPARLTGHSGSRTTSFLGQARLPLEQWFVLSALELRHPSACAVVALGDSLTDGRGSTTNGCDRWPDRLAERLLEAGLDRTMVNAGIGGNTVLEGGLGPSVLERFERDVLGEPNAKYLIVFAGINDLGTSRDPNVVGRLATATQHLVDKAQAQGLLVALGTLLPFGGSQYTEREPLRQEFNAWLRSAARADALLDFDRALLDPEQPERLQSSYDSGDHLHLNPLGYLRLAQAIPLELFT